MNEDKGRLDPKDASWEKVEEMPILITPFSVSPIPEYTKLTGETGLFYPFWFRAILTRNGQLKPDEDTFPYIPRTYLEPQVNQEVNFVFSNVDRIDEAFGRPFKGQPGWASYRDYILSMFKTITGQELETYSPDNFAVTMEYIIVINNTLTGAADGIIGLYDYIIQQKKIPVTLNALAEHQETPLKPLLSGAVFEKPSAAHLGQMTYEFPLSKSQRTSLYHYSTLKHGDILAINGPPGTGKTTLLQSVVATEIVQGAIAGGDPRVILACSANNQAVTNIIDSFSNAKQKKGTLYERWLPELKGFGLYLSRANREVQAHIPIIKRVQGRLAGAHTEKENENYISKAEAYFIARSENAGSTVSAIINSLQQTLKANHELLIHGIDTWQSYQMLTAQLPELSAYSLNDLEKAIKKLEVSFSNYLDAESIWLKLFSFLNFVREKRATRAKQLFRDCPIAYGSINFYQIKSIQQFFDNKLGLIEQLKRVKKIGMIGKERQI